MSVTAPQGQAEQTAFELRATTFTLPTLRLFSADLGELSRFLPPSPVARRMFAVILAAIVIGLLGMG